MVRYEGLVFVSGSAESWAVIEDVDVPEWVGTISEIRLVAPRSGLHTIRIGEGPRAGSFAVMEVDYDEERRSGTIAGRTPFGRDPQQLSG